MKTSKVVIRAKELKEKGFVYMASIVKIHFKSEYYHIVKIDTVIEAGKWVPANKVQFESGARGRVGVLKNKIDWSITARK